MKGCPYDTNRDGDCHLCSKPGWRCAGDHPEQVPARAEIDEPIVTIDPLGAAVTIQHDCAAKRAT